MAGTPLEITLYDPETNEIKATYVRTFVPWKLLKRAAALSKLDMENIDEEEFNELAGVVVATFGDKFTIAELDEGADVSEMITVITQIVAKANAGGGQPNPTRQGK